MSPAVVIASLFAIVFFAISVALVVRLEVAQAATEKAEEALAEHKLATSSLLNWAVVRLGDRHPEVEPICAAIEKSVLSGRPLEADRLDLKLLALNRKGGAS